MESSEFKAWVEELSSQGVTLVAVSKTRTEEEVMRIYDLGHRDFGENRIQEINRKAPLLPSDIRWHLIGPLQSKKVKMMENNIHLFHAIDRLKILKMTDEHFSSLGKTQDVLIQVHIAREDSKHGFSPDEVVGLFEQGILNGLKNFNLRGLMGMATNTDNEDIVRSEFDELKGLFTKIKQDYLSEKNDFDTLSMGMSGDYQIAMDCGATMIRVGTKIFGPRQY
jgi:pyridoxal phosphate enzyme (YggS family)